MSGKSPALAAEVKRLAYLSSAIERKNHKFRLRAMYVTDDSPYEELVCGETRYFTSYGRMREYLDTNIKAIEEHLQLRVNRVYLYGRSARHIDGWKYLYTYYPNRLTTGQ